MLLERKLKKIQKNSKKAALDPLFLERYLYGNRGSRKDFSKKIKKIRTIRGNFGKILVRSDPDKLQASRKKNRKKSEKKAPLTAFVERYLFGWIGNKFRCGEGNNWKNGKKSKTAPQFSEFLERYLFGDDHRLKKNFVKKFKKIPQ